MGTGSNVFEMIEARGLRVGDTWLDERGPLRVASELSTATSGDIEMMTVRDHDRVAPAPGATTITSDVTYRTVETASGAIDLRLDIVTPATSDERSNGQPLPIVVFVTGGGFMAAPKASALDRRRWVAEQGFVVASVEYRTVRHGTYVEAIDDVVTAIDFVTRRCGAPDVALWGESAGGYLASMVAASTDAAVRCVVNSFGLSDLAHVAADYDAAEQARHHTPDIPEAQFVFGRSSGLTIDDDPAVVQQANPVTHIDGNCPPFLLFHGELDGLVSPSQTSLVHDALCAHGVASDRVVVAGAGHYGPEWSSGAVLERVVAFLRVHAS